MQRGFRFALAALALAPFAARGDMPAQVTQATPGSAGAMSGAIDRFTLRFSESIVPLGDPRAAAPATTDCAGATNGHWVDQQTYVIEFAQALPGGTSCKVSLRDGLATLRGTRVGGLRSFTIDTGGPAVRAVLAPGMDGEIDEDQVFLVATNVPADPASVAAKAGCAIDGIGESAAVDVLPAATFLQALDGLGKDNWDRRQFLETAEIGAELPADPRAKAAKLANVLALKCRRPLPPRHDMALVWPKDIADRRGKPAGEDQRFDFTVRAAFTATFSCSRTSGTAGCSPIQPATLRFSAPIPREQALAVRFQLADGTSRSPVLDDGVKNDSHVSEIRFDAPFPESAKATLVLPANIRDLSGRALSNAARFPLGVSFDAAPPLVKFAAGFGIVEAREDLALPVSVRAVEPSLGGQFTSVAGKSAKIADDDAQIAEWLRKLDKAEESNIETVEHKGADDTYVNHTRDKPLLTSGKGLKLDLPGKGRAFEVVGVPLGGKGFHVVELASPRLGKALLGRDTPRYVAAGALVTDMAVHFKWGRESSLVWVTQLSSAKPVAGAAVRIIDSCTGQLFATGRTGANGVLAVGALLPTPNVGGGCEEGADHPLMVSARTADDMSFTLSSWNRGISPYDFDLSFGRSGDDEIIHTVFDRALVRVGETVHFKHILRKPVGTGFSLAAGLTGKLVFSHLGSDTRFEQTLAIGAAGFGEGEWQVPQGAPLGDYALRFEIGDKTIYSSQQVRVDEYKLPTMRATITGPDGALVQPGSVPLSLFVGYLSGGGAGGMPVTLRTDFSLWSPTPKGWDAFSFGGDDVIEGTRPLEQAYEGDGSAAALPFAQTLPATLGADGTAKADIAVDRALTRPVSLTVEMDYPDANGETMTASRVLTLYPAALQVGLRSDGWMMRGDDMRMQMVVLDLAGKPVAGARVQLDVYSRETITARRRLIGGFYAYDNQQKTTKLGAGCSTTSDGTGRAGCKLAPGVSGEVTVVARVKDSAGRETRAVRTVWLAGKDDWWFGGDNGDRMDVIPEAPEYKAGETAKFQVRMPFREATALVTVEREGVLSSFITTLSGTDPVVSVKLPGAYAPNVYVSVMAVRGRVGGWRLWLADLAQRWHLPFLSRDGARPTALVDLAKPAYRIGVAQVKVGWEAHQLAVTVKPERDRYSVRDKARVAVTVRRPDGKPAAQADVAFVAVDEALLQLMPNPSWKLLDAMMGTRNLEVATSTAQMQVVGKRHYGRKAVAAGGGGGDASGVNRENFQPVLLWKGHVTLDGQGRGTVEVPLSDSLSRFRLVAVATEGADLFGTGEASVRTAQDLSIYPGLPPLVRTGDRYDAVFTLRNGSDHAMTVVAQPAVSPETARFNPLTVTIQPGRAGLVRWTLAAPQGPGTLNWSITAREVNGKAHDAVTLTQEIAPAVPVETWAASLLRVGDPAPTIAVPQGALPGGNVSVALSDTLAAPLDGVRSFMRLYPYDCFEQRLSRIIVQGDTAGWNTLAGAMPTYLDGDGLLRYWPDAGLKGSTELTAYVLATTSAAGLPIPDAPRQRIVSALRDVVEGRLTRERMITSDERLVRIAALAALARANAADPALVARIDLAPGQMPTSTLADWIVALDRLPTAPRAAQLNAAAEGELRRRLVWSGTRLDLADGTRAPWWLMTSTDEMAIRALDAVIGKPGWSAEVPRMMVGVGARQQRGHWDTTLANAWGTLVSRRFAAAYPASAIAGTTRIALGSASASVNWPRKDAAPVRLPLLAGPMSLAQSGGAGPWATVTVNAAVPLKAPLMAGYRLARSVAVVSARRPGKLSQGDVVRVRLTLDADAERNWVALVDPLPPGATVLSGLGGQSALLRKGEAAEGATPDYAEARRDSWRAYFGWLPRGRTVIEYTVRLNAAGSFTLPPARAEAMYAPAIRAQLPVPPVTVWAN